MRETRWKGNLVSLGSVLLLLPRDLFNNPFPRHQWKFLGFRSNRLFDSIRALQKLIHDGYIVEDRKWTRIHVKLCLMTSLMVPWFSHRVPPWPGTPGILKMIYISRNLMPVGCFTGPTTLDFMKFNISRPRNYGLMDFTTESTESWMCSNGIYIYIFRDLFQQFGCIIC